MKRAGLRPLALGGRGKGETKEKFHDDKTVWLYIVPTPGSKIEGEKLAMYYMYGTMLALHMDAHKARKRVGLDDLSLAKVSLLLLSVVVCFRRFCFDADVILSTQMTIPGLEASCYRR